MPAQASAEAAEGEAVASGADGGQNGHAAQGMRQVKSALNGAACSSDMYADSQYTFTAEDQVRPGPAI